MSTPGRSQSQSQFMGMSWSLRPLTVRQALRAMQVHSEAPVTLDGRPLDGVCLVASIVNVSERPQCYVLRVEDGSHGRLLVTLWKPEKERGKNSPSFIENGTLKEGMYARIHGRITCDKRFPNSLTANDAAQVTPVNDPHEIFYHLLLCMWVEKKIDKESLQPPEEDLEEAIAALCISEEPAQDAPAQDASESESQLPDAPEPEPEPSPSPAPPSPPDGVEDRGADDAGDAGEDANEDANVDANEDANVDANEDANVDANEDADVDANEDANEDATDDGQEGADPSADVGERTHSLRALSPTPNPSPPPSLRAGRLNRTSSTRPSRSSSHSSNDSSTTILPRPLSPTRLQRSRSRSPAPRADPLSALSPVERDVVLYILNRASQASDGHGHEAGHGDSAATREEWVGVGVADIARSVQARNKRISAHDLTDALESLLDEGYIFTTVDESHYDVSDNF